MTAINLNIECPEGWPVSRVRELEENIRRTIESSVLGRDLSLSTSNYLRSLLRSNHDLETVQVDLTPESINIRAVARRYREGNMGVAYGRSLLRGIDSDTVSIDPMSMFEAVDRQSGHQNLMEIITALTKRIDDLEESIRQTDENVASLEMGL